jgi:Fur family peroxide stress response transcriptional regulator
MLLSTRSHPTAEWLYTELRRSYPNMSMGTVYRNLAKLSECGEILKLSVGDSSEHYDGFTDEHDHFVCTKCGSILDIRPAVPKELNEYAEKAIGAKAERHSLVFYGKCSECSISENEENIPEASVS